MRRLEFPGKRRLRLHLAVPSEGRPVVRFPEGMSLRLDLSESLQRDFYAGLHDRHELRLVRRFLAGGGDFVDVGAHVGLYAVRAAMLLRGRGRVLAFEPNPVARAQLEENVRLNACDNVIASEQAASSREATATLAVPRSNDPSFSTLDAAPFEQGEPIEVATTTVDAEVERHGLRPALVKIDVQDHEVAVLDGMQRTLALRPAVLCEVGETTVAAVGERFPGWRAYRVGPRRLHEGLDGRGYYNALFLPGDV